MQGEERRHEQNSELPSFEEKLESKEAAADDNSVETSKADGKLINAASAGEVSQPTLALVAKHPLAIRWMHWINFPLLALMIYSGLLIYWADSHHEGLYAHQYYRVGFGDWTLFRLFPEWFYKKLDLEFQLAKGLGYHFFFMWFFALNGLLYALYTVLSGEWRYIVPNRKSFKEAWQVLLHDLGINKDHPPRRKFNGAQQFAYTGVILMGFGSLLTGLAIYKPTQLHLLTTMLGGYETARWLHFWLTMGFVAFFLIHVAQVTRAGWNNFRSMIIGFELIPRSESSKEFRNGKDTSGTRAA
jgi:thiosulfate reductase cytochrome b subunit